VISGSPTGTYSSGGKDYAYFTFTGNGTLVVSSGGLAEILVVGGGGGCADSDNADAGGGGGGVRFGLFDVPAGSHTVTVGAGGAGTGASTGAVLSTVGGFSAVGTVIKIGGGSRAYSRLSSLINFNPDGGGGGGGGTAVTAYSTVNAIQAGAGAGGEVFGSNRWDGLDNDYTGSTVTYGTGGEGNGAGAANTGEGGAYRGLAGGSGVVIVRVEI